MLIAMATTYRFWLHFAIYILIGLIAVDSNFLSKNIKYKMVKGFQHNGLAFAKFNSTSVTCTAKCELEKRCVSTNFIIGISNNKHDECQLFDSYGNSDGNFLEENEISTYFEKISAPFSDCLEAKTAQQNVSGIFVMHSATGRLFNAFCDMATNEGGWMVIQRRIDGRENFDRSRTEYKSTFGNINLEFWLGLNAIHEITTNRPHMLRIDLWFDDEHKYAEYETFKINDESDDYRLTIGGYSGDAGDSLTPNNNLKFSTYDYDLDLSNRNCADVFGGGWWYRGCHPSTLNARYDKTALTCNYDGMIWKTWKGQCTLTASEMKIKPKSLMQTSP